ncbi:MAG TPA: hypothetical protein VGR35_01865 [Tepidisphaeraceae bacterium]|nr:hypothetical protein [Tepidisphaeraceae bacterium]
MTLWEVITSAREGYLGAYRQALREQRKKLPALQVEALVAPAGAEHVPEQFRWFRADLLWQQEGKPMVGALDVGDAGVGGMCDTVYPDGQRVGVLFLRWDDCEFRCAPAVDVNAALVEWVGKWADRAQSNQPDADGLHAAVHSATPPQRSSDGSFVRFAVDFGSAPPEAFTALLSALFGCGVSSIQVGS